MPQPIDNGPEFDFSGINRKWSKRWMNTLTRVGELEVQIAELSEAEENGSQRARQQLNLIQEFERMGAEQEKLLSEVLVSVPQNWLSADAPDDLDWHDPESLDYVLETRYPQLIQSLQAARQLNSKN